MEKKLSILLGIMGALLVATTGCSNKDSDSTSKDVNFIAQEAPVDDYEQKNIKKNISEDFAYEAESAAILAAENAEKNISAEGNVSDAEVIQEVTEVLNGTNTNASLTSNIDLSKHKIIQKAIVSFTTTDYDKSFQTISDEVNQSDGYIETADINGIKPEEYADYGRSALIVIRVPAQKFESVLQNLRGTGILISEQRETTNISAQYRDTQARLETIDIQIGNLQQLLAQTKKLEDMLRLEEEISRLIYEKEGFQSKLQTWDDLVQYATIEINLREINTIEPTLTYGNNDMYERSFGQQMGYAFEDANVGFLHGLQDFLIWSAEYWIGMFIFIIIVVAVIMIIKKTIKKRKLRTAEMFAKQKPNKKSELENKDILNKDEDDQPRTPPIV